MDGVLIVIEVKYDNNIRDSYALLFVISNFLLEGSDSRLFVRF